MKARALVHKDFTIARIDDRIYGGFLEHLGRAIYTGIHEPDHPSADEHGMRGDVIDLVRELNVPITRYPGGNFVSAYNWEDGIGPKDKRPTRLDLAWHTADSNQVGIHEFAQWAETVGTDMMLAVNLGSRGLDEARAFLEYVNHPEGTYWSDLRIANGRTEPWNVKVWCLGNEMDGPWQIGHKKAEEYARLAHETAKAMRAYDNSLELVLCGSAGGLMPTFPQWEVTVLDECYEDVDFISLHTYAKNDDKNMPEYLAHSIDLDGYITAVEAAIRLVKAKHRSSHDVYISLDEWNVWYHTYEHDKALRSGRSGWPHAPRLLEDIYNFEDVLQVALILNTIIRRSDIVRMACIAQLVNVIAPIMTEPGGPAWRQTIFYPYLFASRFGRGTAMQVKLDVPGYKTAKGVEIPFVDATCVLDEAGQTITFFVISRHPTETIDLVIDLEGFVEASIVEHKVMTSDSLEATNTLAAPETIVPQNGSGAAVTEKGLSLSVPPFSYQMIRLTLEQAK